MNDHHPKRRSQSLLTSILVIALYAFMGIACLVPPASAASGTTAHSYGKTIRSAITLMNWGKLSEAYLVASVAVSQDEKRWEAYTILALVLNASGNNADAIRNIDNALGRCPAEKKVRLREMKKRFELQSVASVPVPAKSFDQSVDAQRRREALLQIAEDADKAPNQKDRAKFLREFLTKSADFVSEYPERKEIWLMRAVAAIELDYPSAGFLAGYRLKELQINKDDDSRVRTIMVGLERKGWLKDRRARRDWSKWTTDQVKAAAEEGDAEAQTTLADWYMNGETGLPKDRKQANDWYGKAAEQNDAYAQNLSGFMALNGMGCAKDISKAAALYQKAALQGLAVAQFNYADLLSNGRGVVKNETEAAMWYRRAADQGLMMAQNRLGSMYANGVGVAKSKTEAAKWYRKAADHGDKEANDALRRLGLQSR